MKRRNLRTNKIYTKDENGNKKIQYAVEVRLRGKTIWTQARKGEEILIFDNLKDAEQVIIDIVKEAKKTLSEKINDGKVKPRIRR